LTPERWDDLERLFGPSGAYGGCWCMWWRVKRSDFEANQNAGNKRSFKAVVKKGPPPGLLACEGNEPVGWCAVGPREDYPVLQRSHVLKPVDDVPVWSVTCFFIEKHHRRSGVAGKLLKAAVDLAKKEGAVAIEGYPVAPKKDSMPDPFAFTGVPKLFEKAGFREIERRSETRPIMRLDLGRERARAGTAPRSS
jgi:GNAT superfamily N-acetyltransferase